ncbi:NAD(P)/FAD-dependent oxidoreductase [Phaeobacter sp. B1627]|uniref:dihydrolipoyl dehydrogenase family protein n=1 Tax=Phaeobacter sp. B1627 TaxID=2583809 RepID=UPI0011181A72|nr:FAD-dependent oxidoreductase [Phaeobacter sp. B1627]TNJ40710.1 dihydrolipoamide dehydrogenase [Phaeobacter sp. B1627]
MEKLSCDLLIIGAGSAGLSLAAGASQMGADVVLLERHKMGGDCLNYGCVPSKALLASAHMAHAQSHAAAFGIRNRTAEVDYAAAQGHVQNVIEKIAPVDSQDRFEGLGVNVIREAGRFVGNTEVEARNTRITARRIVIATGSRPLVPPIKGLGSVAYLTNETLWELREQPEHLIVIGGGPIGMEMAQAHRRLGSKVTVLEAKQALGRDDPEAAGLVLDRLRGEGVEILEETSADRVRQEGDHIVVETSKGDISGSHLLVAVGRQPNVDGLNLEAAGIETSSAGIHVDTSLRTTNAKVYAIGDVAGQGQFTHLAGYHASVIIRSLLFALPSKARSAHIPRATYTDPELSQVGLTEAEARAQYGARLEVARFDYSHNDRAIATRQTEGFIKVMVVRGRPVGATIAGPQAGELIATWSLALANRLKMSQIAAMVAPYPTIAELNKRVAGAYFSPRLFENSIVKRGVWLVQRWIP